MTESDLKTVPLFYKNQLLEVTYRRTEIPKDDGDIEVNLSVVKVTTDRGENVEVSPEMKVDLSIMVMSSVAREDVERGKP